MSENALKLIWLTDIHLNFLEKEGRQRFYKRLAASPGKAILLSGDISEAPTLVQTLQEMAVAVNKPIYFVLGNHDYYHGSVSGVRKNMRILNRSVPLLRWLTALAAQPLDEQTLLAGSDTWADGRAGNYAQSSITVNDSRLIADLFQNSLLGKEALLKKMQYLAGRDARALKRVLVEGIERYRPKKIILLLHVPPFEDACVYAGGPGNPDFLPFFCSHITGATLMDIAKKHPEIAFLVLCGHTHNKAEFHACPNLIVKVGAAEYNAPDIQALITLD